MPKRLSKEWRPKDVNQLAHHLVPLSTESDPEPPKKKKLLRFKKSEISRVMSEMGRIGGRIGGKRRLVTLTPEQRRQIAVKAARRRWEKARNR